VYDGSDRELLETDGIACDRGPVLLIWLHLSFAQGCLDGRVYLTMVPLESPSYLSAKIAASFMVSFYCLLLLCERVCGRIWTPASRDE